MRVAAITEKMSETRFFEVTRSAEMYVCHLSGKNCLPMGKAATWPSVKLLAAQIKEGFGNPEDAVGRKKQ